VTRVSRRTGAGSYRPNWGDEGDRETEACAKRWGSTPRTPRCDDDPDPAG